MSENYKSIAVDHETWLVLNELAEEECRSVRGQIKYLIKKNFLKIVLQNNSRETIFFYDSGF